MEHFQFSGTRFSDTFICTLEGDEIVTRDQTTNERKLIGMRITAYNELLETTNEYYDKLVEVGVIVPEKSQEEVLADTQAALLASQQTQAEMLVMMKQLKDEMEAMKHGAKRIDENDPGGIPETSAKPKRGRSSAASTAADKG